jgi:hypothetical protein
MLALVLLIFCVYTLNEKETANSSHLDKAERTALLLNKRASGSTNKILILLSLMSDFLQSLPGGYSNHLA